ncbi:MAG: hypothetical protein H5T86_13190, partial [Armatimonadetes bacterium]|nr:hypothetical protein [Armatimonadota bacterium]
MVRRLAVAAALVVIPCLGYANESALAEPEILYQGGLMWEGVVAREKEKVFIVSNIPEDRVMGPVCREALTLRPAMLQYVPLHSVGTYGKTGTALLPEDWKKEKEVVIVVDWSSLAPEDAQRLRLLLSEVYPGIGAQPPEKPRIEIHAKQSGRRELQVVVMVPEESWLAVAAHRLWSVRREAVKEKGLPFKWIEQVWRVGVLTNEPDIVERLCQPLGLAAWRRWDVDKVDEYAACVDLDVRAVLLNWNGEKPIPAGLAQKLVP